LSFVSGMPVSFVYDLYTPVYRERPSIKVEQELSAVPMQTEETFLFDMGEAPAMGMVSETRKTKPRAMPKSAFFSKGLDQSKKIKTIAQASGELFEYTVGSLVSIMNNHSALLPITAGEIDGKPVSFYNEENRHNNPFSCMWLKNTTGLTLEGGAATIYENDTYAGEAVLKTLKPGEKTFVSYSVDLGVLVETSRGSKRKDTHMIKIVNGLFRTYYKKVDIKTYMITNKTNKTKTLILEHPFRKGWNLIDTPKPIEETKLWYRFQLDLKPESTAIFPVSEAHTVYEAFGLNDLSLDEISVFVEKNYISQEIEKSFENIVKIKSEIVSLRKIIQEKENQYELLFNDQERIRKNLRSLKDSPAERKLAEDYVSKLSIQEKELEGIQSKIIKLKGKKNKLQTELSSIVGSLEFEKEIF
jgi:hypothetical protein